jgi:xanthine/CO dehydrogenase XdhC/CoxF family maturation factor
MSIDAPDAEDILPLVAAWLAQEGAVALATVVKTWGSSPRPAGSQMAMTAAGRLAGSVSGGCIEAAVLEAGQETLRTGQPQTLAFGVTDERAWELGLACGGRVQVFVERVGDAASGAG